MRKRPILSILIPLLILISVITGCFLFQSCFLIIDGSVYPRDSEVLDLSGKPLEDIQKLSELTHLRQLDLRDTQLSVENYEYLQKELPQCRIQWLVPFQGAYLPLDTRRITVTELTEADISLLSYLPELDTVDATACEDYDAILALQERYPGCRVLYQMTLSSTLLNQDTALFSSTDIADITTALAYFPKLSLIDAIGCEDFDTLLALQARYPQCHILYRVPFCGSSWRENTTQMHLSATTAEALGEVLPYLPMLKEIVVEEPIPDPENLAKTQQAYPDIAFFCRFDLFGTTVSTTDTLLDISGNTLGSVAEIEQYVPLFQKLEKVDMCGCGIANEDMAALNERWPDTLFVWEVTMGHFKLRTDITYFMPYQYRYKITDADADTLKYLTELICLDFGHMDISRTDYLAYMPKMQYLLMCDTPITDLSPLANMKELKYLEVFMTDVTDFSPLLECESLVDLNICYTYPEDPLIFGQMTQLQTLWFRGMMDEDIKAQLREALPNARLMFGPGSSTGRGWRELPNYYAQRDILGMPYMTD